MKTTSDNQIARENCGSASGPCYVLHDELARLWLQTVYPKMKPRTDRARPAASRTPGQREGVLGCLSRLARVLGIAG